jgi:hypothetical protein
VTRAARDAWVARAADERVARAGEARPAEIARLRRAFDRLARVDCPPRSPLYARLCGAIAGDDEVLAMMLSAPRPQRRPMLLLAAIHDLLLSGVEHPLAAHVPTVAGERGAAGDRGDHGELALDLCRAHRAEIAELLATRATQTNEVNRTCALRAALACTTRPGQPLRLVELGASAGLNLLLDRYAYSYDRAARGDGAAGAGPPRGGGAARAGPQAGTPGARQVTGSAAADNAAGPSSVLCACTVEGEPPGLGEPPLIAERIGVDLDPIDVRDERAARWLLACIWPDEADRVARLRAAIAIARADPPPVVRGDGLALLGDLVGPPGAAHPVIWHSWVLAYWAPAARRALADAIDALGVRRDLTWIYLEQASEVAGLPMPVARGVAHDPGDCALVAVTYRDGARVERRLADAHAHVHEMRWFA